jgi:hypothetical protein
VRIRGARGSGLRIAISCTAVAPEGDVPTRAPFDTWRLELFDLAGGRLGGGLCVADGQILTAATSGTRFRVRPVLDDGAQVPARVVATGAGVVVARPDRPLAPSVRPAPVVRWRGRRLAVRIPDGATRYARGTVLAGGPDRGVVQLDGEAPDGDRLTGAAVATADPAGQVVGRSGRRSPRR